MNNVVRFDRNRKKDPGKTPRKPGFWTVERLAWPALIAVALIIMAGGAVMNGPLF